jgi:pimeloyl-ACP methyl ester carboxylesterase
MANASQTAQFMSLFAGSRDIILFDQRGVGLSQPALECPEFIEAVFDLLDEPDPNVAAEAQFEALMACRDNLLAEGHDLSVFTTAQSAADVNAIREALGYDEVNLYGGSYGSFLAQAVMRDYPDGVRSAVIESVYPLEASLIMDAPQRGAKMSLRLLAACEEDADCNSAYPDIQGVLFDLIEQLNDAPVPVTVTNPLDGQSYAAVLSGDDVYSILLSTFYQTPLIPALPQAISDVARGDYALITQLSGARLMLYDLTSRGMMYSVLCAEDLIGRTPEELLARREELPEQLRGRIDPENAIRYGIFGLCDNWPVEEADPSIKEPLVSDIPTLIIAGEYDAVTPPEYARLVAEGLSNGYLFEIPAAGHGGDTTGDCAASIIAAFFDDPSSAPDGSCIDEMPGLAFDLPSEPLEITLEPWSDEDVGLEGVVPAGWLQVQPGTFARAQSALDPFAMQLAVVEEDQDALLGIVTSQFGLAETPESVGEREANGLIWTLYSFEAQGAFRFLALAGGDGRTLVVVVRCDPDEQELTYDEIVLPVVDALVPIE